MLGLSTAITKAVSAGRTYVKDGLKLYMPYRGSDASEVKFVGTGSTYFVTNDYVDTGATFQTTFDGSFTISCWVKPDDGRPDSYQYICGIYGVSGGLNRITLINGTSGELNLRYRANDAGSGDVSIDSASIWANGESTWKHIVAVGDSTVSGSGGLKLYVNGEEIASGNTSSVTFSNFNTVHNFILGSASFATSGAIETYTFDGSIKNVAIWNRALTATEVQNVMYKSYVNVSGRLASGLVSWWALDASSLGSELLSNSSFSSWTGDDPDNWIISGETADNYVTQNGADADYVIGNPSANPSFSQNITTVVGAVHQLEIICTLNSGTFAYNVWDGTGGYSLGPADLSDGTTTVNFTPANTTTRIMVSRKNASTSGNYTLKSISVKEVNIEDLKGSNDGSNVGATIDTDLYGGDTPVIPRAIDNARTVQADAIGAGSASFNGSSDSIRLTSNVNISGGAAGTIALWAKPTSFSHTQYLWSNYNGGNKAILTTATNVLLHSSSTTINVTVPTMIAGAWNHIAVTKTTGDSVVVFINGVASAAVDFSSQTISIGVDGTFRGDGIGKYGGSEFAGNMCQFGAWSKVLTQAQVQRIMERTYEEFNADDKTDLVSYWALDEAEKVLDFVPANVDYVDLGNPTALQITDPAITVSAWCLLDADDDFTHIVMNSNTGNYEDGYNLFYYDQKLHFSINHWSTNVAYTAFTDYGGGWHHVVGTYDGTNIKIYLDGSAGTSDTYTADIGNIRNTFIGAGYSTAPNETWDGRIAKVAIYNTALSAAQVLTQYNLGINGDYSSDSNLAGYWKLDNATTVTDLSGNGNNGTVNGADLVDGYVLDKTSSNNDGTLI